MSAIGLDAFRAIANNSAYGLDQEFGLVRDEDKQPSGIRNVQGETREVKNIPNEDR